MINVLVPVTENPEKFMKSVLAVCEDIDVQLIIGVTQSIGDNYNFNVPNAILDVFPDNTDREQMINAFQSKLLGEGVFIARKPFTKEEFYNFINQDAQIVVCKNKPKNFIMSLFYKWWCWLVRNIFGVKFFDGDTSLIYFEKGMGIVLASISNLSYSTRIDRWKGQRQTSVQTSEPPAKAIVDARQELVLILSATASLGLAILVTVLVAMFAEVGIIAGLLLACFDVICVILFFMMLLTICFNKKIGKKEVDVKRR